MNQYPSRAPSRISRTSESDLSLCEYITDPILENSLPYQRGESGRSTHYWYQSNLSHYSDCSDIDITQTESRMKELEGTLFRSKNYLDLTKLTNHSGSSDSDSDSEHLRERLHPRILEHVQSMKTPVEMVELTLFRSSQSAGFGLSLSDGYLGGVYVNQIQPGGLAAQGGLLPFDKIMKVCSPSGGGVGNLFNHAPANITP